MVNKTNFNIIMSTISKYWKCVCPLAVTTKIMHAFLIVFMRAACTNYPKLSDDNWLRVQNARLLVP